LRRKGSKRLEDRIYILVEKAIAAQNTEELEAVNADLRAALKEHTERLRKLVASQLVERGSTENGLKTPESPRGNHLRAAALWCWAGLRRV